MTTPTQQHPYVNVPETVSKEAQEFLRTLRDPALMPAFPDAGDLAGWKKVQAFAEAAGTATSAPRLKRYEHTVGETSLGGVPVLDVRPKNWTDNGKVLVYTHGGAHVMSSAASTLGRAVIAAHETGLRVISVDYTLAPFAKYDQTADPNALDERHARQAAAAYAALEHHKDPYASPVYGDYATGFPPTLIQGGLKEVLLSGFVRMYQALDTAGVTVKLDLYEGMIHNFPDRIPDAPEAIAARQKMRAFLHQHLGL